MSRKAIFIGLGVGAVAYLLWKQKAASDAAASSWLDTSGAADVATTADDWVMQTVGFSMLGRTWEDVLNKPENEQYKIWLYAAEDNNGIPRNILARLAYQESHFKPGIIDGSTVSSAGAQGIMQIIPKWNPGVDPLNPADAIAYAGKKLAGLFKMFGTWELALQGYNWGEGNLKNFLSGKIAKMPTETVNYSRQILADVGAGSVYA